RPRKPHRPRTRGGERRGAVAALRGRRHRDRPRPLHARQRPRRRRRGARRRAVSGDTVPPKRPAARDGLPKFRVVAYPSRTTMRQRRARLLGLGAASVALAWAASAAAAGCPENGSPSTAVCKSYAGMLMPSATTFAYFPQDGGRGPWLGGGVELLLFTWS